MLINCTECGKEMSDKADKCPNCGCPIVKTENKQTKGEYHSTVVKQPKKKEPHKITLVVGGILGFIIFISLPNIFGNRTDNTTTDNSNTSIEATADNNNSNTDITKDSEVTTENNNKTESQSETQETEKKEDKMTFKKFKKTCSALDYKKMMRNPDDYIGQNFKITISVFSISEGSWLTSAYIKAFIDDDYDKLIYLFDERDENDKDYFKILDDDKVEIYGTFEGLEESKNALNGEKSEAMALHIKYAKLISE